jgi:hypothetical protein
LTKLGTSPIRFALLRCPPYHSLRRTSEYASLGLVGRLALLASRGCASTWQFIGSLEY